MEFKIIPSNNMNLKIFEFDNLEEADKKARSLADEYFGVYFSIYQFVDKYGHVRFSSE